MTMTATQQRFLAALPSSNEIMMPEEVAQMLRVDARTVARWAQAGKMDRCWFKTPGGHYRFHRSRVMDLIKQGWSE